MEYADIRGGLAVETEVRTVNYSDMSYDATSDGGRLVVKGESIPMEEELEDNLLQELSIPTKYLDRCPPELKEENVNYWLGTKAEDALMITRGGKVHGMLANTAIYVPTLDIFDRVFETLHDDGVTADIKRHKVEGSINLMEVVVPETRQQLGGGDGGTYYGGLTAVYSDILTINPKVDSYWWREICTNGMRATEGHARFRYVGRSADQILGNLGGAVRKAVGYVGILASMMERLRDPNRKFEDFDETVLRLLKEQGLPKNYLGLIRQAFEMEEPGGTQEHLMNAVTRAANLTQDENVRINLQTLGGAVMQDNKHRCNKCYNVLLN